MAKRPSKKIDDRAALKEYEKLSADEREFCQLFMMYGCSKKAGEAVWPDENERFYSKQMYSKKNREYIKYLVKQHNELIDVDWLINRLAFEATNLDNSARDRISALKIFADAITGRKPDEGGNGLLPSSGDHLSKPPEELSDEELDDLSLEELERLAYEDIRDVDVEVNDG